MEHFQTLLILIVVIWVAGKMFRALSLPVIFGELLGGILVGPMVLGLVHPDDETIKILAELGIFFLMLHAGLETKPEELFRSSKKSIFIALGGVTLPFVGGYFVSQYFGRTFEESLFVGMVLSVTAIAISVRLLKDNGLQKKDVAHIALGAAIVDDILALILFSMVLSIIDTGNVDPKMLLILVLKVVAFFTFVILLGHKTSKYLPKILKDRGFTFTLVVALGLGFLAEYMGLHAIIGAFLAGLFIREEIVEEKIFRKIEDRIYGLSYSFLGPIFFASLAFHLNFEALGKMPLFFGAVLVAAVLGKIIGAGGMAYLQKIPLPKAALIGFSMNTRGAVEIIILSIAIQKGAIGSDIFSILVTVVFCATIVSIFSMKSLAKKIYPAEAKRIHPSEEKI